MIIDVLKKAQQGQHLSADETYGAFREIMGGEVENPVIIAALLTAMQMNVPTIEEVTGAARAMRGAGVKLKAPADAVDIVGTGGDGFGTFNEADFAYTADNAAPAEETAEETAAEDEEPVAARSFDEIMAENNKDEQ